MPGRTRVPREGEPVASNMVKFEELFQEDAIHQDERKKRVGGYILGRTLGEGSFAKVRIGTHIATNEKVAVKVINKKQIAKREYVRKNMRREAVMMQRLAHPNIVKLIEVMETENSFYMVTELAEGGDFMKYLTDRNNLSEEETRKFMRQIVSAVDHMHRSGVLHRDLKIENLLLDADINMKIIDFGLSNHWDGETLLATQCGSPAYAAPEIFAKQDYGPEVDVWSIGINMYAMLTGRLPFLVDPPNNLQKLHALIQRGAKVPDFLSKDCQDLLSRLLEPSESRRITMSDLMLHPWLNDGHMPIDPWGLKLQPQLDEISPEAVWYMVEHLNVTEDNVKDSVINFKPNATTGNYLIICQRLQRGLGLPNGVKFPNKLLNGSSAFRRSIRQGSTQDVSGGSTIQTHINAKKGTHTTEIVLYPPVDHESRSSHNDTENYLALNGHTTDENTTDEVIYQNLPGHKAIVNGQSDHIATHRQETNNNKTHVNTGFRVTTPLQALDDNVPNSQVGYTSNYGSAQNGGYSQNILRQNTPSGLHSKPGTPRVNGPKPLVNQEIYDLDTIHDNFKPTSLPDIPNEVGLNPGSTYRDTMRVSSRKRRPKKNNSLSKPADKSTSVPDNLNFMSSGNKQKPGHLADSISLRNAVRFKYNSKPENLQTMGVRLSGSRPEGLGHMVGQQCYVSQQYVGMDPNTVIQGTHQLTPSEAAQLEALRAKEIMQKRQMIDTYADYPSTPPSTTQTPRRYDYTPVSNTPTHQSKYSRLPSRERSHMHDSRYDNRSLDDRDRTRNHSDLDRRKAGVRDTPSRIGGAYSKENGNAIGNAGFYTYGANSHGTSNHQTKTSNFKPRTRVADSNKYQSPFVRRESRRLSDRGPSKGVIQELFAPRTREHTNLPQTVTTPR